MIKIVKRRNKYRAACISTMQSGVDPHKKIELFCNDLESWMDSYIVAHPEFALVAPEVLIDAVFDLIMMAHTQTQIDSLKWIGIYFAGKLDRAVEHVSLSDTDIMNYRDQCSEEVRKEIEKLSHGN